MGKREVQAEKTNLPISLSSGIQFDTLNSACSFNIGVPVLNRKERKGQQALHKEAMVGWGKQNPYLSLATTSLFVQAGAAYSCNEKTR